MKTLKMSLLVFLVVAMSCKKDETAAVNPSKTDLLTTGSWKPDGYGFDLDGNGSIDSTEANDACDLDDLMKFNVGGSVLFTTGTTLCDSLDSDETGTWAFLDNETKLIVKTGTDSPDTMGLTILNTTNLQLRADWSPGYLVLKFKK